MVSAVPRVSDWARGRLPWAAAYVEDALRRSPARLVVPLCQRDQLLGQPLRLLGLCMRRLDVLVLHQLRHQAAQQRLPRRRVAAEMPVLDETAGHCRRCGRGSVLGGEVSTFECWKNWQRPRWEM